MKEEDKEKRRTMKEGRKQKGREKGRKEII